MSILVFRCLRSDKLCCVRDINTRRRLCSASTMSLVAPTWRRSMIGDHILFDLAAPAWTLWPSMSLRRKHSTPSCITWSCTFSVFSPVHLLKVWVPAVFVLNFCDCKVFLKFSFTQCTIITWDYTYWKSKNNALHHIAHKPVSLSVQGEKIIKEHIPPVYNEWKVQRDAAVVTWSSGLAVSLRLSEPATTRTDLIARRPQS